MSRNGAFGLLATNEMVGRLSAVFLSLVFAGCSFSRTVTNGYVRRLDTSWIRPGVTTRADIVDRLGRPPAMTGIKGEKGSSDGALGILLGERGGTPAVGMNAEGESEGAAANVFRWYCGDSNLKMFEGGWLVHPTFSKHRQRRGHDILILFDERDVVKLLSRTEVRDGRVRILEWKERAR